MARCLAMAVQRGRLSCCVGSLFLSCLLLGGAGDASSPWRLGFLMPAQPEEAAALRRGVEAGIAAARKAGVAVDWIGRSRTGQWGVEGEESARLALDDGADGLIAPPAGASTHLVLQVAGRTAVPVVSLCADTSVTGAGVPWLLQITPDTEAQVLALWAALPQSHSDLPKKWMAVVPAGRAGREVRKDLEKAARQSGVLLDPVWALATTDAGVGDAGGGAAQPGARKPAEILPNDLPNLAPSSRDGLLVWLEARSAAEVVNAWCRAGRRERLAGPARLCSGEFRRRAGEMSQRVSVALPARAWPARAASGELSAAEDAGRLDWDELMAQEAVLVLVERLKLGERGNEEMRRSGKDWPGVGGPIHFDPWGKRRTELRVSTAEGSVADMERAPR